MPPFPDVLQRFADLFNAGRFWDSHEVLEEPWRVNHSDFYQGLILYASAFVHVQRRNPHGVQAQLAKAERYLQAYRPTYLGVDVDAILRIATASRETLDRGEAVALPTLTLSPARVRGDEPELTSG